MAKQPMSAAGVDARLAELYALSDTDLKAQAGLIRSNFKGWVTDNFTLDAKQSAYLSGMDSRFADHAGAISATAMQSRLPIKLIYPSPPSGPVSSKYIVAADDTHPRYDSAGGYTATGSVTFEIGYNQ